MSERHAGLVARSLVVDDDTAFREGLVETLRRRPGTVATAAPANLTLPEAVAELEVAMIRRALADNQGSRTEAARQLGINRQLRVARLGYPAGFLSLAAIAACGLLFFAVLMPEAGSAAGTARGAAGRGVAA